MLKDKLFLGTIGALVLVAGLAITSNIIHPSSNSGLAGISKSGEVPCLSPDLPLQQHIHPHLSITVDGKNEIIPANIGLGGACEHAIHTHDDTGKIHVEAQDLRAYTLGDFFNVYGKAIRRNGYNVKMTIDGSVSEEYEKLVLKDKQEIFLNYTKIP